MTNTPKELKSIGADNSLLILDDDEPFRRRLARAMEKRGFIKDNNWKTIQIEGHTHHEKA